MKGDGDSLSTKSGKNGLMKGAAWVKVFFNVLRRILASNMHIITILSMMVYSIVFHSLLGFIFLLVSNVLWVIRNTHVSMINISPIIAIYSIIIIIFNYFYNFDLTREELEGIFGKNINDNASSIGLRIQSEYPAMQLILKSILLIPCWMTMLQKYIKSKNDLTLKIEKSVHKHKKSKWSPIIKKIIVYSWIWSINLIVFLMGYLGTKMTMMRIINMTFVLVFLATFQVSFRIWKKFMHTYFFVLIVYSKILLTVVYVYQFNNFVWRYDELIGLFKFEVTSLFFKLFSLSIISVMSGIYLNYFQKIFLTCNEKENEAFKNQVGSNTLKTKVLLNAMILLKKISILIEIHFYKFIFVITFNVATTKVCI